jgi:hypothetical protein
VAAREAAALMPEIQEEVYVEDSEDEKKKKALKKKNGT